MKRATFLLVFAAAFFVALGLFAQEMAGQAEGGKAQHSEVPPKLLLVASDPDTERVQDLVHYLSDQYSPDISVITPTQYTSFIDERAFDGFIYLGNDYIIEPPESFLFDMAHTQKPVLWINYHAWMFDTEAQTRLGIFWRDEHSSAFTKVNFNGMKSLGETDTTIATANSPARILYWLFTEDLEKSIPGALISNNFTFIPYLPEFFPNEPSFTAFRAASDIVLSMVKARSVPVADASSQMAAAHSDEFRAGIHLPFVFGDQLHSSLPYDSDNYHPRLLRIRDAGADWVTISQTFFQDGIRDTNPAPHPVGTATYSALENIASDAHKIGLFVRLSVIVNLVEETRAANEWRGMIRPQNPEKWWDNYRAIIFEAARFAMSHNIESLNVGAELNRMEVDEQEWRRLVDDIRNEVGYKGLIGYQINYNGFDALTWGDALDYISVAAYWPLSNERSPSLATLKTSWEAIGKKLEIWQNSFPDIKLEFGEIGYTSQPYTSNFPFSWRPNRAGNLDLDAQLQCYLALEDFLQKNPDIAGVSIFASTDEDLYPGNVGYSPFGKPAEEVMTRMMTLR